jgi:hypothetical protein
MEEVNAVGFGLKTSDKYHLRDPYAAMKAYGYVEV